MGLKRVTQVGQAARVVNAAVNLDALVGCRSVVHNLQGGVAQGMGPCHLAAEALASCFRSIRPLQLRREARLQSCELRLCKWHVVLVFAVLRLRSTHSPRSREPKDSIPWGRSQLHTVPPCWGSCAKILRRAALLSRARCSEYLGPHQSRVVAILISMRRSNSLLHHESRVARSHTFGCHLASHLSSCLGRSISRHSIASTRQLVQSNSQLRDR